VITAKEQYTSLIQLYNQMMFPKNPNARQWTLTEIDQLDVHFFYEVLNASEVESEKDEEVYLSDVW